MPSVFFGATTVLEARGEVVVPWLPASSCNMPSAQPFAVRVQNATPLKMAERFVLLALQAVVKLRPIVDVVEINGVQNRAVIFHPCRGEDGLPGLVIVIVTSDRNV